MNFLVALVIIRVVRVASDLTKYCIGFRGHYFGSAHLQNASREFLRRHH